MTTSADTRGTGFPVFTASASAQRDPYFSQSATRKECRINGKESEIAHAGEHIYHALAGDDAVPPWETLADIAPELGTQIRHGLGAVIGRPQLDLRTRELATICMLAALGGAEPQLRFHIRGAIRAGATPREVIEALNQVQLYAGLPRTLNAIESTREVFTTEGIDFPSAP